MLMNPILAQFASEPAFVEPAMQDRFEACLTALAAHGDYQRLTTEQASCDADDFWFSSDDWRSRYRPYVVKDGVLQIPAKGVLLHNFGYAFGSYATGYDYIWRAFERGCRDFKAGVIKGIALVEDSPGGMVAGCFDTVDKMDAAKRDAKVPVRAFAHESAYSAAYAIACAADHIAVSRTGGVGSIGVVTMHVDMSEALKQRGLKITFIHAGKHKVDGNPAEPLADDVKARIQARIDELYQVFVSAVARGRGMEEQAVRDTEAATFTATQAVSNGLADSIGSLDDALSAFAGSLDDLSDNNGDEAMAGEANTSAVDQAAHEAAVAAAKQEGAGDTAAAVAAAKKAERERVSAITGSDEAEGRESLANHIAMNTEMSVDDAKAMLAAAPKAEQQAGQSGIDFEQAMDRSGNPNAGGGNGGDADTDKGDDVLASLKSLGMIA